MGAYVEAVEDIGWSKPSPEIRWMERRFTHKEGRAARAATPDGLVR